MANHTNWLNISSMSGSSGQTILTLSANKNLSTNYKTAEITAYNPVYNISAKTYVTLEAYSPILSISPSIVGIPASGGTYELHISANCGWVIAFPDIVTSYSTSASSGDAVVTFTVPNTICASTLVGNIVVTDDSGQISRTCRVEQYGEGAHISVSPTAVTLPYYGGSEVFTVTADCVYSVEKGSGQWYSLSSNSGYTGSTQFTVSGASTNSGDTDWTDSITVVGPDGVAGTVQVTQLNWGQYHFNYTADTSIIAYSGETRTITVDTTDAINSSITIEIVGAPDVTYTYAASGLTRGIITLNVPQNPGGERHFKVIVTGRRALSQNNSTAVIEYTQEALRLNFTTDTSNVKGIGETRTITILNTNINPNGTGLNLPSDFPQQGSYTVVGNTIYITYPRNPSSSATRSWTIGVVAQTNDGVSLSGSYSITQDANTIYSIPYTADTSTVDASGETRTITIDTSNLVASSITIGVQGATGVTYTYHNGVITIVFPDNSGGYPIEPRTVTVTVSAVTLDGKEAYASIIFTQEYEYTGESRVFIVYEVSYYSGGLQKILYGDSAWSSTTKVELADGTDITNDVTFGGNSEDQWYGYDFGGNGCFGVYFTFQDNKVPAYAFDHIGGIKLAVIPDITTWVSDEAFDGGIDYGGIISFGKGMQYFGRKILQYSAVNKIIFNSAAAPVIYPGIVDSYSNLFWNVPSGGTLLYPCGSDYSNYTTVLENEHSWSSVCFSSTGTPSTSLTYDAYLLGDLSLISENGETRSFKVGGLLDDNTSYSYSVVGPSGTSYVYSGDTVTVTVPQNTTTSDRTVTISVTATSYNGLFVGTGELELTQNSEYWTIVTYEVASTTVPTRILNDFPIGATDDLLVRFPDGTQTTMTLSNFQTGYTFSATGIQTIKYQGVNDATTLYGEMFNNVSTIKTIAIASTVETITYTAFSGCANLTDVIIPSSVTAISFSTDWQTAGYSCFIDCHSLSSLTIPDSVVYLTGYKYWDNTIKRGGAFCYGCSALTCVTIGRRVVTELVAFEDCPNLTSIYAHPQSPANLKYGISGLSATGTLYYYSGSDYSQWLSCLGSGWTGQTI